MDEGTGTMLLDDIHMYTPFLHPLVVNKANKVGLSHSDILLN